MKTMRERADIPKDRTYADALTETAYAVLFYDPENPSDCCYRFCAVRQKEEDYFVARIETGGGLIEMDSEQLFVLLLPWKSEFDFYDAEGNPVTAGGHVW